MLLSDIRPAETTPSGGQAAPAAGRARLLCIDDSPAVRNQVQELMRDQCDVVLAANGLEGLRAAKANPPDVILSDWEMPELNGLQLLLTVKADPTLKAIPFIVFTGKAHERAAAKFLGAGAEDFLHKPFTDEELRARVGAAVRTYRTYQQLQAEHRNLTRLLALLAQSEARTRAVVESALDAIFLLDEDGRVAGLNPAAEKAFGWSRSEAAGRSFLEELIASGSRSAVADLIARPGCAAAPSGRPARWGLHGLHRDGHEFPIECNFARPESSGEAVLCAFVRDLTERQRLQMELEQSQKLEAVGRLAAGIAHELNTPIQFIGDNTRFLEEATASLSGLLQKYAEAVRPDAREALCRLEQEVDLDYLRDQVPKTIARTLQGVQRVASIVRAMKEFAHPDQKEMVATDLNRSIQATLEVARNEYKYVAELETELGDLPLVVCHAGELNQVVLNLVVNAAHAIGDAVQGTQNRGTIRVATRRDGSDAVISISDTGRGIPEAIRGRIFEPFFTTKAVGRGTGQGLAMARTTVTKHGGSIRFETEEGKGTTFIVRVPIEGSSSQSGAT